MPGEEEGAVMAAAAEVRRRLAADEPASTIAESIYEGSAARSHFFVIAAFFHAGYPLRDAADLVHALAARDRESTPSAEPSDPRE